jgi:hypothetical protein
MLSLNPKIPGLLLRISNLFSLEQCPETLKFCELSPSLERKGNCLCDMLTHTVHGGPCLENWLEEKSEVHEAFGVTRTQLGGTPLMCSKWLIDELSSESTEQSV